MDNGFGYHGQENRGAFLVDIFCGGASVDADDTDASSALETPAPSAAGTMGGTMEGRMGSIPAANAASGTTPPTPVLTMASSATAATTPPPGTDGVHTCAHAERGERACVQHAATVSNRLPPSPPQPLFVARTLSLRRSF